MNKDKFLQIRLTEKKHDELKKFCEEQNVSMSQFVKEAIFDKMKKMNVSLYDKEVMNKIKELSKKLNKVKQNTNNTKTLLEKQEISFKEQFEGFEKVNESIKIIEEIFRKKPKDKEVGYTQGKIIEKSGLPREQVFYVLRYSGKVERTGKNRWVMIND